MSLTFTWLGVAGVKLQANQQVLAIDPFFTRPSIVHMLGRVASDSALVAESLPACDFILVTHAHYDHLLDVAQVIRHTGAVAYGSANTCQLLYRSGITPSQAHQIQVGDNLSLGDFEVEVIHGQHSPIPFGWIFNGKLPPNEMPARHVWNYRMDTCLGYRINIEAARILICAARPYPADLLFAGAQEPRYYYQDLCMGTKPRVFVPIHWDNFTRPLNKGLREFNRPGRGSLHELEGFVHTLVPGCKVLVPRLFIEYSLEEVLKDDG